MKRSYITLITIVLILVECVVSWLSLNEMYRYVNQTLQTKYVLLMIVFYMSCSLFTIIYWIKFPELERTTKIQSHLHDIYQFESFNFAYTYHFLVFAGMCFFISSWPFLIMSMIMFCVWNYVRVKQNERADVFELETAKQNAKKKPTVVLDE